MILDLMLPGVDGLSIIRRSRDGAGLGLAIAKGLVERHGGTIWAEERASGGARVAITLPPASTRGAEG